jgi:RNA-directed DNA polymerase
VRQGPAARDDQTDPENAELIEKVLRRENMRTAFERVVRNGGAPGVDGVTVKDLGDFCRAHWPRIRKEILEGRYRPQPVRRVEIPKPSGDGVRTLGIPTVMDRMIQQAIAQVLTPIFDPSFSDASFGFRPGRSAQAAVQRAQAYIREGYDWVVDLDLERFFDRVNHDVLMARLARRIRDKKVLLLIRRYLQAGMMEGGVTSPRTEGTPQGGPLSPLLSNILLDEWDKELERRGHRFVRYADDCNVYVRSEKAGERVMASAERFLEKRLRLRINRTKSAVGRPWDRVFLGYGIGKGRKRNLRLAEKSVQRLKKKLKSIFRTARGRGLAWLTKTLAPILRGWIAYFRYVEIKEDIRRLDQWVRRRTRCLLWRLWKNRITRFRRLLALGVPRDHAAPVLHESRGPWWWSGTPWMNQGISNPFLARAGLVSLLAEHRRLSRST